MFNQKFTLPNYPMCALILLKVYYGMQGTEYEFKDLEKEISLKTNFVKGKFSLIMIWTAFSMKHGKLLYFMKRFDFTVIEYLETTTPKSLLLKSDKTGNIMTVSKLLENQTNSHILDDSDKTDLLYLSMKPYIPNNFLSNIFDNYYWNGFLIVIADEDDQSDIYREAKEAIIRIKFQGKNLGLDD